MITSSAQHLMKKHSQRRKHYVQAVVSQSQKITLHRRPSSRGRGTAKI